MDQSIDSAASTGFNNALAYLSHRPSYPQKAVTILTGLLPHVANIVDLAAGTGKFTELLAGWDVIAVEPHAEMREVLYGKHLKGVSVLDGTAENMSAVDGGWADAVVVAQVGGVTCILASLEADTTS